MGSPEASKTGAASALHLNTHQDSGARLTLIERCAVRCARLQGYSLSSIGMLFSISASGIGHLTKPMSKLDNSQGRAELRRLTANDLGVDVGELDLVERVITLACELLAGRIAAAEKMHGRRRFGLSEAA